MNNSAYTSTKTPSHELLVVVSESKGWLLCEIVESDSVDRIGTEIKLRRKWLDQEYRQTQDGWQLVMGEMPPLEMADVSSDEIDMGQPQDTSPVPSPTRDEASDTQSAPSSLANGEAPSSDDDSDLTSGQRMGRHIRRYADRYVKVKAASGKTSKVNGDAISLALAEFTPREVAQFVSALLGMDEGCYSHLNPGQVRMNWGNRLRAAIRNEILTEADVLATIGEWTHVDRAAA